MLDEKSLKRLRELKPDDLSRKEELGTAWSFEKAVSAVAEIKDLLLRFDAAAGQLPTGIANSIPAWTQQFLAFCDRMKAMTAQEAPGTQAGIIQNVNAILEAVRTNRVHLVDIERSSKGQTEQLEQARALVREIQELKDQAAQATKASKAIAGEGSVAEWSKVYEREASDLRNSSRWWLGGGITVVALVVSGAVGLFRETLTRISPVVSEGVSSATGHDLHWAESILILVAAGGAFLVAQAFLRVFRAYRHMALIARHRAVLGRTFPAVYAAAEGEKGKMLVLGQVVSVLASADQTGLVGRDRSAEPVTGVHAMLDSIQRG